MNEILQFSTIKNNIFRITISPAMKSTMITSISKNHKIFYSVVISDFVNMMHNFFRRKIPPQMFFGNKTMFKNITVIIKRMFRFINRSIPLKIFIFSIYPHRIFRAEMNAYVRLAHFFSGFFRRNSSFIRFTNFFSMLCRTRLLFTFIGFTYFSFSFSRKRFPFLKFIFAFQRAKFSSINFVRFNPKFFFAKFADFFNHNIPQIKKAVFRYLKGNRYVPNLTHRLFWTQKNLSLLDNISIA